MAREMKDSGIEWIGKIPKNYSVYRLKHLLKRALDYGANSSGVEYSNHLPRYIRITDIAADGKLKNDGALSLELEDASPYILEDGDILFARSGATVGKSFIYHTEYGRAAFAGYLIRAQLKEKIVPEYVYYYTCSTGYDIWKNGIFIQSTIQNISADKYANLPIVLPKTKDEQMQIVSFLKNTCVELDNVIEKTRASIEEYKKLKQSVISQAVTRGIRGDREMKDSGYEIIGMIPYDWEVCKFGKCVAIKSNLVAPEKYMNYLQIAPDNIEKAAARLLNNIKTVKEAGVVSGNHLFHKGQIIYSKIRPMLNKLVIAPFDGLCSADMYPIETENDTEYIVFLMLSDLFLSQVGLVTMNRVKMPKINQSELINIRVSLPKIKEQREIAEYLKHKCTQLDEIIDKKEQYLREIENYKKSLIYEYITGKKEVPQGYLT